MQLNLLKLDARSQNYKRERDVKTLSDLLQYSKIEPDIARYTAPNIKPIQLINLASILRLDAPELLVCEFQQVYDWIKYYAFVYVNNVPEEEINLAIKEHVGAFIPNIVRYILIELAQNGAIEPNLESCQHYPHMLAKVFFIREMRAILEQVGAGKSLTQAAGNTYKMRRMISDWRAELQQSVDKMTDLRQYAIIIRTTKMPKETFVKLFDVDERVYYFALLSGYKAKRHQTLKRFLEDNRDWLLDEIKGRIELYLAK